MTVTLEIVAMNDDEAQLIVTALKTLTAQLKLAEVRIATYDRVK